jgi:ketosteroid isomerase-like protein
VVESDSDNLRRVKEAWHRIEQDGVEAGWEALFEICDPDCVFRPSPGARRVFHGVEEWRAFLERERGDGADSRAGAYHVVERDDCVEVVGWVRLIRPDGGLADSQGKWTYRFRDGRVVEAAYAPGGSEG